MGLRTRHWCLILFAIAFCLRVAGVVATHQYYNLERFELERISLSLASTGVFGNPYAIPTGPSAHVSPGYALVLAAIFRMFGTGVPGEVVKELTACAVTALQCALMPLVARRFGFDPLAGLLAGFAAALLPLKFLTETQGDWESNWAALALMLISILTVKLWTVRTFTMGQAVRNGLGWGLSLLFSWGFAPLYGAVLAAGFFIAGRAKLARYALYLAVMTGCVALSLAPWIVRNWRAFGAFIPGRTNTGIELRVSNNDQAVARESLNFEHGIYHRYHPLQSVAQAQKVLTLGEVEYNRQLLLETRAWIAANPGRFARLTVERFGLFWLFPDRAHFLKSVVLWTRMLLSLCGLVIAWRAKLVSARVIMLIFLVLPLPNYLVHVGPKHSYALDWILTLLACFAISDTVRAVRDRRQIYSGMVTS